MAGGGSTSLAQKPPDYMVPYLQKGLSETSNLYDQGGQVAQFSDASKNAQNMVTNRAAGGDPTIGAATSYVQNSLNGGFLNSNPYLDATFEKARLATQTGLSSEFARSGRNVDASQGLRGQQVNDLATSIYGGAYENDRNRQQGVLPYAQQLGNQTYTDAAALSQVGAQQEAKNQENLDAKGKSLDEYLGRINSGNYGSTSVETSKSDPLSNIAGGALIANDLLGGGSGGGGLLGAAKSGFTGAKGLFGAGAATAEAGGGLGAGTLSASQAAALNLPASAATPLFGSSGMASIGTGAIDTATAAGANSASAAINAANAGGSATTAAPFGTVASAGALGVLAPFLVGQSANKEADLLPAPVQIKDPRTGEVRWTQSKKDLTTTQNDIQVWNARQGNIRTTSDEHASDADWLNNPDYLALIQSILGPNYGT